MSYKLKTLCLPLTLLSLSVVARSPSIEPKADLDSDLDYETSIDINREVIENSADEVDIDTIDQTNEFDNELDSFIGIQKFTFKAIAIIKILR